MNVPHGRLLRSRVVSDPATALSSALDRELTGYAVLEPQDAVLLAAGGQGILTFEEGIPVLAYHTGSDRGGPAALADVAVDGPSWLELYELPASDLAELHDATDLRVQPTMPANRLAGDASLVERTRERAPASRLEDGADAGELDPVEAFLEDESKVEAIRERAREQAEARAEEWGFGDAVEQ
ncbi:hypothetical protein VB773_00405 [Haloarculaceae archaeon H-GB2-1]|nr:hypothetical protein [Haloarculaceae archaeon H-GB1-1]MEA5388166.1 hypothetical protein [Haloarculaceae archaeon H-GB11]MEA5406187.1 hypothetical protein [Haloarculaceae archaeon H-GB2-1]